MIAIDAWGLWQGGVIPLRPRVRVGLHPFRLSKDRPSAVDADNQHEVCEFLKFRIGVDVEPVSGPPRWGFRQQVIESEPLIGREPGQVKHCFLWERRGLGLEAGMRLEGSEATCDVHAARLAFSAITSSRNASRMPDVASGV